MYTKIKRRFYIMEFLKNQSKSMSSVPEKQFHQLGLNEVIYKNVAIYFTSVYIKLYVMCNNVNLNISEKQMV